MTRWPGLSFLLLLTSVSITSTATMVRAADAAAPTRPAFDRDVFPIMCWEHLPVAAGFGEPGHGLASLAECGFTVVGFVQPEHLAECERLGLRAILGREGKPEPWEKMTDERIDETIRKRVELGEKSPAVIGYFVTDEPGVQKFPALAKAVNAVHKHAPGKLAYINLYPDYATLGAPNLSQLGVPNYTEYLERFVGEVKPELISYDNYRVQSSGDLKDAKLAASYYNNLLAVRTAAMKSGVPFWVVNSGNQVRKFAPPPSPANLQFQAYTSLAAGARGLTWYKYYQGKFYGYPPINDKGDRTVTWTYLKMVNDQVKTLGPTLLKLQNTGVYFTDPAPVDGLPKLPGKIVQGVECKTPVMVGEFAGPGEGEQWVIVVNLSLAESAKPKLTFAAAAAAEARPQMMSPADGSMSPIEPDNSTWLTAGQGALIRMR
jgi:hypothetical protein